MTRVLTGHGNPVPLRRPRRRSDSTGGDTVRDEEREGYVVDPRGKIRGEVRNYDPYSRFGEIMLYDIDSFGFISGYVSGDWNVMSEEDLLADRRLARRLYEARYRLWKRRCISYLRESYENRPPEYKSSFERFCRNVFRNV